MPAGRPERMCSFACHVDIKFHLPHIPDDRPQALYLPQISVNMIPDLMLDLHPLVQVSIVDHTEFEWDVHGGERFVKVLCKCKGAKLACVMSTEHFGNM
jgi:hypothetical protein